MSEFDFWKTAYELGWANIDQMAQVVILGLITEEEKQLIVG